MVNSELRLKYCCRPAVENRGDVAEKNAHGRNKDSLDNSNFNIIDQLSQFSQSTDGLEIRETLKRP